MANFPDDKKYNKIWKGSNFSKSIFEGSNISRLKNDANFLNKEQTDKSYPSRESFDDLNEISLKTTTNQYIIDDYIDDYFNDLEEFFDTYNTGSFTGEFTGSVSINEIITIQPVRDFPASPPPGSFITMSDKSGLLSLYFFNGNEWILLTK